MDSWVQISVPLDHVTLLSIPRMLIHTALPGSRDQCDTVQTDTVRLYKGGNSARNMAWKACHVDVPSPEVYDSRVLFVRFISDRVAETSGFKLLYSFHQVGTNKSRKDQPFSVITCACLFPPKSVQKENFGLSIIRAASSNQNFTNKSRRMVAMFAHNLKNSYRVKDRLVPNTCFKINDGTRSTMTRKQTNKQVKQITFV